MTLLGERPDPVFWVAAALTVYTGWGYLVASLKYMED